MKRNIVLGFCLILFLSLVAYADRIVKLPEDSDGFHLSLFLHDNWKNTNERNLVIAFDKHQTLIEWKRKSFFHIYTSSDKIYKTRFANAIPRIPAVILQSTCGKVLYKASNIDEAKLVAVFGKRPWLRFRPWKRPRPNPDPEPEPEPVVPDEDLESIPKSEIPDTPISNTFPWILLIFAGICAGGITLVSQWKRRT